MTVTEIGVMHLEAKKLQELLATPETKRKSWNRITQRAFRESMDLLTP